MKLQLLIMLAIPTISHDSLALSSDQRPYALFQTTRIKTTFLPPFVGRKTAPQNRKKEVLTLMPNSS
ncbi:hypothetical protein RRG08_058027 [Elysia crispata]|uniref:Uncharacterized protein n=1 Tax=Elysia crispata TaxID=231223 RepID=A0AAE1APH7_9GAST|nr:hypothetical protein RRG08_058027 [Elysia crispata]